MKAVHLKVTGRVQGVFFRSTTKEKADELGITGWVKNCQDGSVEILAQGDDEKLKEFEEWCHQGPEDADVQQVDTQKIDPESHDVFEVSY
jgi:acylphosphatase